MKNKVCGNCAFFYKFRGGQHTNVSFCTNENRSGVLVLLDRVVNAGGAACKQFAPK